jgi:hypothetical protein
MIRRMKAKGWTQSGSPALSPMLSATCRATQDATRYTESTCHTERRWISMISCRMRFMHRTPGIWCFVGLEMRGYIHPEMRGFIHPGMRGFLSETGGLRRSRFLKQEPD